MNKPILDACCGGKMFYFDKNDPRVLFMDCRQIETQLKDRNKLRKFEVKPDVIGDFTQMEFADATFRLVVFDPPPFEIHRRQERSPELADGKIWLVARSRMAGYTNKRILRMFPCIRTRRNTDIQMERDRYQGLRDIEAHAA